MLPFYVGSSVFCNWKKFDTQNIGKIDAEFSLALLRTSIQLDAHRENENNMPGMVSDTDEKNSLTINYL